MKKFIAATLLTLGIAVAAATAPAQADDDSAVRFHGKVTTQAIDWM